MGVFALVFRQRVDPETVTELQRPLVGPAIVLVLLGGLVLGVTDEVVADAGDTVAIGAVAVAVLAAVAAVVVARRPLPVDGDPSERFASRTFAALGIATVGPLIAFLAVFASDAGAWPYLVAVVVALGGYALLWPTTTRVDAAREALARRGVDAVILGRGS